MLVNLKDMLNDAVKNNYAIGAFNTPSLDHLRAVVDAAEELDSPVIINFAQCQENVAPIEIIGPIMVDFAKRAKVPVCPHIDHGLDMNFIMKALRIGFTSIMYDCSTLPFEQNASEVKRLIELVRPLGITVEAEIGEMPSCGGDEPGAEATGNDDMFTDPAQAVKFAELTGCDALAISFGTIHGMRQKPTNLDVARVAEIKHGLKTNTALVMHGGSCAAEDQIQKAIAAGISKVNYFTALDVSPTERLTKMLNEAGGEPVNFAELAVEAREIIKAKCKKTILLFQNK